jgi:hypothetical protein
MKVAELIQQLQDLNKPDAEITLMGNLGHPEDDEADRYFDVAEVWNDGENSITLFFGMNIPTEQDEEEDRKFVNDNLSLFEELAKSLKPNK